tara:strand:- start:249 stop:1190 length:942 start_codon:yes stop_codon:yes gene_type:complete
LYKLIEIKDKVLWDTTVVSSKQFSLLCSSVFLNGLTCKYDLFFIKKDKDIKMAVIIFKKDKKLNKYFFQDFNYNQGFYFFDDNHSLSKKRSERIKLINFFLDFAVKKFKEMRFSLHESINDIRAFQWYDYKNKPFAFNTVYSSKIDFSEFKNFTEFLKSIRYERRREYKKINEKENFSVKIENNEKKFIKIYKNLIPAIGKTTFNAHVKLIKNAIKNNYARINFMYDDKKLISATLFYFFKDQSYYAFSVIDPDYKKNFSCTAFLILEQINFAFKNDIAILDFLGVNSPNRADFKESLGGSLTSFYELVFKKR